MAVIFRLSLLIELVLVIQIASISKLRKLFGICIYISLVLDSMNFTFAKKVPCFPCGLWK